RLAVHVHDTGPALGGIAADMGSGETELVADEVDEQRAVLALAAHLPAIDGHCHFRHAFLPGGSLSAGAIDPTSHAASVLATRAWDQTTPALSVRVHCIRSGMPPAVPPTAGA